MIPIAPADEMALGFQPLSCHARPMTRYGLTPCLMPAEYNIDFVTSRSRAGALGSVDGPVGGSGARSLEAAIGASAGGGLDSSGWRHPTTMSNAKTLSQHTDIRAIRIQRGNVCGSPNAQSGRLTCQSQRSQGDVHSRVTPV